MGGRGPLFDRWVDLALDGTGVGVPGFPRPGTGVPAVADLDRDARVEIVVASNPDSVAWSTTAEWGRGIRGSARMADRPR